MNHQIKVATNIFLALFVILILNLTYLVVISGPSIAQNPSNNRAAEEELTIERGKILTSDGVVLAESIKTDSRYKRTYPAGDLAAHIVGYSSPKYGKSGLEREYNTYLLGKESASFVEDLVRKFKKPSGKGNSLTLTIDSRLQRVAVERLKGKRGAVVALDPKTGAVLAMVSNPTFDPNFIERDWRAIQTNKDAPLFNRAIQQEVGGGYPPGSSFKIITTSAALEEGVFEPSSPFTDTGEYKVLGTTVKNYGGKVFGEVTLRRGLEMSINTVFAQVGLKLGAQRLVDYAERFGFNEKVPFDLPVDQSAIQRARSMDDVDVAWSAIGQARVVATPLVMALATATIANNGTMMKPFLVKEIEGPDREILRQLGNESLRKVVSSRTAATMRDMMVGVVEKGTGGVAQIPGYSVAAKTGTAELGVPGVTHAWFVSFAPADDPQIAVAVIVEKGGVGGETAGPIAKDIMAAALQSK